MLNWIIKKLVLPQINKAIVKEVGPIGEIKSMNYHKSEKRLTAALQLQGEIRLIKMEVTGIEVLGSNPLVIRIEAVNADREWISMLCAKYVNGKSYPIMETNSKFMAFIIKHLTNLIL